VFLFTATAIFIIHFIITQSVQALFLVFFILLRVLTHAILIFGLQPVVGGSASSPAVTRSTVYRRL
jgi:hypothetical protein